jgi:hypothetical protein
MLTYLVDKYPALALGAVADNPASVKKVEQVNSLVRLVFSVGVTAAVTFGLIPNDTDIEQTVMVLSGLYVAASSVWTLVSQIISTKKLGFSGMD